MYDRILLPLDGSKSSEAILPTVVPIALGFNARVVLLTVNDLQMMDGRSNAKIRATVQSGVQTLERPAVGFDPYMREAKDYLAAQNIEADLSCDSGKVAHEILAAAEANGCGLIAMSTHGRSGLGRGVLGSVTDAVVRSSHITVLVNGPKWTNPGRNEAPSLNSVVVLLDGSKLAERVLPHVEELVSGLDLDIALVRVVRLATLTYTGLDRILVELIDVEADMQAEAEEYCGTSLVAWKPKESESAQQF